MRERPAFDCTRGQHFLDFRLFSPGCPLLGALLPRRASSRSPARTLAGGGLGRAHVASWGVCKFETQALSPRWHRLHVTALPVPKNIPYLYVSREYPICTSQIFLRLHTVPLLPFQPSMLFNT